jgi:hypothetical protein
MRNLHLNIEHFRRRLETEPNDIERQLLLRLLTKAEALTKREEDNAASRLGS